MQNEPKIFQPNKWKFLLLAVVCAAFVAIGWVMLEEEPIMGGLCVSFFGLCLLVALIQLLPNASYLKLDEEGFEVKTLFRTHFTRWSEVKDFRAGQINGNKMIFYNFTAKHKKHQTAKKVAKFLSTKEGALPSNYTIQTKDLLELMKEYKRNAADGSYQQIL
ncbi:PH domain-containing protein [Pontibacter sp. G13]|uniref:PH domain-containing protein n=1 Tax=Pontibacter sp. G13 TaxID=3074898 RepID=UPI00288C5E1E|nr:PH domain-containing protein [Pontibacter sp. G13]WNJ17145.1 PH domain-containing protein [Pontibacter sp. G13]